MNEQQAKQKFKVEIPSTLKSAFSEYFYGDDYPKERTNFVGICKFQGLDQKDYTDGKIFNSIDKKPLLFDFYEYVISDEDERKIMEDSFLYDISPQHIIKLDKGFFDTLVPMLFDNELHKIIRYGLFKSYELHEENLQFLRGKIIIKAQISNEIRKKPYIASRYWDITTDNFVNQVLFRAASILSSKEGLSIGLKSKFFSYCNRMRQERVSLVEFNQRDLNFRYYIPKRYTVAIKLAEAIIRRNYHSASEIDKVECPSFMLNAANIWESFLRVAVKKTLNKWSVKKIKTELTILEKPLNIEPDILAQDTESDKILIIDAKYKSGSNSPDIYQLCAYLGAFQETKELSGILLYYSSGSDKVEKDNIFYPLGKDKSKAIPINIIYLENDIDKFSGDKFNFDKFEKELKTKLLNTIK